MKNDKKQSLWVHIIIILISALILFAGYSIVKAKGVKPTNAKLTMLKAKVTAVMNIEDIDDDYGTYKVTSTHVTFKAKINDTGKEVIATQLIDGYYPTGMQVVEKGSTIMLYKGLDPSKPDAYTFGDYWRTDGLFILLLLFCVALLIFGKVKGLNTIISMVLTIASVFAVFVPSILAGYNIYFTSMLVCLYVVVMTLFIVNGINKKTFASIIGCFGGILVAGYLTVVMDKILKLTGVVNEESLYISALNSTNIDLRALIFAAIIIGAMGAIMDVSMGISASLHEICQQINKPTYAQLMKSGLAIGRDTMGTMANTLVLAYIGSSLSVVVLLFAYNNNLMSVLNKEMIVIEILQALVGSIGILSAIPLTSMVASLMFPHKHEENTKGIDTEPINE